MSSPPPKARLEKPLPDDHRVVPLKAYVLGLPFLDGFDVDPEAVLGAVGQVTPDGDLLEVGSLSGATGGGDGLEHRDAFAARVFDCTWALGRWTAPVT